MEEERVRVGEEKSSSLQCSLAVDATATVLDIVSWALWK